MIKVSLILIVGLLVLSGCASPNTINDTIETQQNEPEEGELMEEISEPEKVDFKTEDNVTITANLWRGEKDAVLLIHMLNSKKESYNVFAEKLNKAGFTVLALDMRGHGESLEQNGLKKNWEQFNEQDFKNMILDQKAANEFLIKEGFQLRTIMGASIGANNALNYASINSGIQNVILLSPGLDYRGVTTEEAAKIVRARTIIVASEEDAYAYGSSKALNEILANSEFKELRGAGHGTVMFSGTTLETDLVYWLKN
ncbi:alpha/beta fold hydrolase [archaeon]|nr:alpha/beta fold hydrolase [archaeon]